MLVIVGSNLLRVEVYLLYTITKMPIYHMKTYKLLFFLPILFQSCSNNSATSTQQNSDGVTEIVNDASTGNFDIEGKTYYLLSIVSDVQIMEVQLTFQADNVVESKVSLSADVNECVNYKNTPALLDKSKMFHYSFTNGTLEIPELNVLQKIKTEDDGNVVFDNGATFYSTSIVEYLNKEEAIERINAIASPDMAKYYINDIHNIKAGPVQIIETTTSKGLKIKQPIVNPNTDRDDYCPE